MAGDASGGKTGEIDPSEHRGEMALPLPAENTRSRSWEVTFDVREEGSVMGMQQL
jgi:hypothetical protein